MARRPEDTVTLTCPLSEDEQDFVATMMQMTGIRSEANITRLALFHLAKHLDIPVTRETFAQRTSHGIGRHRFGKSTNRLEAKQLTAEEIAGRRGA